MVITVIWMIFFDLYYLTAMSGTPCGWFRFLRCCEGHCGGIYTSSSLWEMAFKKPDCSGHHCKSFLLQLRTRSWVGWFLVGVFSALLCANCCFLNLAASCQTDKDGDIPAAVKTRVYWSVKPEHGGDESFGGWRQLGSFFQYSRHTSSNRKTAWHHQLTTSLVVKLSFTSLKLNIISRILIGIAFSLFKTAENIIIILQPTNQIAVVNVTHELPT